MSSSKTFSSVALIILVIQILISSISHKTTVSASDVMIEPYWNYATFNYVNEGEFGDYNVEYDGSYRPSTIFNSPFQLFFYNTTPNTYYVGLRVGTVRSTSVMRWVWDFNRGNPVRENATFSLGTDGNLVLADGDGRVAWQSGTARKGVVGFKLLPTGNMLLYDTKGKSLWQSFDRPTDTLLVGQSLRVGSKLVSRTSPKQNTNGPYSLVVEPKRFAMYYQPTKSSKPQLYYESSTSSFDVGNTSLEFLKLNVDFSDSLYPYYRITLNYKVAESNENGIYLYLGRRLRFNATITYLRLGIDGTLKAFTFDRDADIQAWTESFDLFSSSEIGTCQLPEKCGKFGLCDEGQCVACPSPNGLLGWSKDCKPPKLSSSSCDAKNVKYYKIVGVDHFVSKYTKGDGPMKEGDCSKKCTSDCKCAGYFYQQDKSMCWIVNDLMTLTKVTDQKHLGYIKF
ncbi:hypothetical protein LIER_38952 [Lithospermum erythrorhizon]|uniref:Bulb-type lectin domain-containing protein n=1 Tax=Lithospermum erythrorhizon TaxID=34254 RepID=A0AAV3QBG9_LITER